jgi:hypothetical protein
MPGMKKGLKKLYDDSEALESRLFSIPMDKYTSSGQMDEAGKIKIKLRNLDKAIKKMGGYGNTYDDYKDGGAVKKMKMGGKVQKMNMGGQVMETTKSMPVGMMDGGKVKKMNMGGVIPGRGGMFKGMK